MKASLCLAVAALSLNPSQLRSAGLELSAADIAPGAVIERGPHHNVLHTVRLELNGDGQLTERPARIVQLEDSINYWDEDSGQWAPSVAEIELVQGIGVARRGQQQALFAPDANDPEGAVTITARDGTTLRSSVLALAYFDAASGRDVILSTVQDAVGELLPPNRILYREALTGLVRADLIYEYRKSGVQQVVLLSESPPDPEEFGLLAEATRLEVLTEFFEAPTPQRRSRVLDGVEDPVVREAMAEPDWLDEMLDFGTFRMAEGRALSLGEWIEGGEDAGVMPIAKRWRVDPESGRTVLFESADYWALAGELARLPASDGQPRRVRDARAPGVRASALNRWAALPDSAQLSPRVAHRTLPRRSLTRTAAHALLSPEADRESSYRVGKSLALASDSVLGEKPGLVLDWTTLNTGQANYVFRGDTTYYITGNVSLTGTNILEGGAVLKYPDVPISVGVYLIALGTTLHCQTAPGRPAVFTSKDDNTVGETIPYSTGSPAIAFNATFLRFYTEYGVAPANLQHIRMAYAGSGVHLYGGSGHLIRHAQFVQCYRAFVPAGFVPGLTTLTLRNVLVHGGSYLFDNYLPSCTAWGEHVTFHQVANLYSHPLNPVTLSLANSLVVAVTNLVSFTSTNTHTLTSDTGVFQLVGSGAHYLAPGSPHRNAGTTDLNAELAADLTRLTTYPPIALSNVTLNAAVTWGPQAARDTDLPDRGYHYVPLDYAVDNVAVGLGGQLSLLSGTVIGTFGCRGLVAEDYGKVTALGSPLQPVRFLHYTAAQELSQAWGCTTNAPNLLIGPPHDIIVGNESPELELRFVEFSQLGGRGLGLALLNGWFAAKSCRVEDCHFFGTGNHFAASYQRESWIDLRNNLFHRAANQFYGWVHLTAHNNLFWGGTNYLHSNYGGNYPWYFHDNAFHNTGLNPNTTYNEYANVIRSHSGYLGTNQATLNGSATGDVTVTNFACGPGPLGAFYHSMTNLINVGRRSREAAGLFHFTVKPALNTKEGADNPETVDIGFHYTGVNPSGQPLDDDADGVADWQEDRNGNNVTDSGETSRTSATDLGLKVWITRPQGGAPLP